MSDILRLVGAKIREVRKMRGLSQESLGEIAGFHFSYIGSLERGERNISLKNLGKIAESLDVPVYELFGYVHKSHKVADKDKSLDEVLTLLVNRDSKELQMAKNILQEIFDTYNN